MQVNKYDIIELRRTIRELKEKKQIKDIDILRYIYKTLGYLLEK